MRSEITTTCEKGRATAASDGLVGAAINVVVVIVVGELGVGVEGARERGSQRNGANGVE